MSETSEFFEAQDERALEWECGELSPAGDWCAKPIDHDGPHRNSWKEKGWAIWTAHHFRRGLYTAFAQTVVENVKE